MTGLRFGARICGRSIIAELEIENALNDGRTVIVIKPGGATRRKRHGHLTSIQEVKLTNGCAIREVCSDAKG